MALSTRLSKTPAFRAVKWLALALLVLGVVAGPQRDGEAHLDPFYVLRGQSFAQFKPRILFAVDTSGSMTWLPSSPDVKCVNNQCEAGGVGESRIASARRAMNAVIKDTQEQASFSLMTFGHVAPPNSNGTIPSKCYYSNWNQNYRFAWSTQILPPNGYPGYSWATLYGPFNNQGAWILCGDNRPFPYLRHDNLGAFSMGQNEVSVLPDMPLYKSKSNVAGYTNSVNFSRKVQFFSRFLGRRVNLNCADPNEKALVLASRGDYDGASQAAKESNICSRNFYYWPYVDGYPGYSEYVTYGAYTTGKTECSSSGSCGYYSDKYNYAGTNRRDPNLTATLFAPFFSQAALDDGGIPAVDKGPLDEADALETVVGLTDPMYAGGIDAAWGTPWKSFVGNVDTYVTVNGGQITPTASLIKKNSAFSHPSIASYLSFMITISDEDLCRPTVAVLITDGQPSPWDTEGSTGLYTNLTKLRKKLGVKSYVVGFSEGFINDPTSYARLQAMACAAAGSNSNVNPCGGTNNYAWDTCADPANHSNNCAYSASDPEELASALVEIVSGEISTPVESGPGTATNELYIDPNTNDPVIVQTNVEAYTDTPGFKGHVVRGACAHVDEDDPNTLDESCALASDPPETKEEESYDYDESGCGLSRTWDAGECLANTTWSKRRIYTHNASNQLIRISDGAGNATAAFQALLTGMGILTAGQEAAESNTIAKFLLGKDMPDGWKLPALANASPVVVRRIPKVNPGVSPSVNIRDPHCGGRRLEPTDAVDPDLEEFSAEAWDETDPNKGLLDPQGGFGKRYDYAEAALIGDDMGMLHAFHLDSGNELFGFVPMALLAHSRELALNGTANFGQSADLLQHEYGVASTVNHGWVPDDAAPNGWRHVAVFGFGPGGTELVALDVSHMGRVTTAPVEVLWTTETVAPEMVDFYDWTLGETWSRPALTYAVNNDAVDARPKGYLVFGSGYVPGTPLTAYQGRYLWMVDVLTGETVKAGANFEPPAAGTTYDTSADYSLVADPAIATHCLSKYWGEMQEAYVADIAGRLYRWDLGSKTVVSGTEADFLHTADSGGKWSDNAGNAIPAFRFAACQGVGTTCTVNPVGQGGGKGDVFTFSPAVVANNRIDDIDAPSDVAPTDKDQFLVALNSGSVQDEAVDGGDPANNFHSSIYLMVDNHLGNPSGGFDIAGPWGSVTAPAAHDHFMRLPLSAIERTRYVEYPDGTSEEVTRPFSKAARPLRAPRIEVTGVWENGQQKVGAEAYYVTYVVYEPGEKSCDPKWFDEDEQTWVFDEGSTYIITLRLVNLDGDFDFNNNGVLANDPNDGFGTAGSLTLGPVEQIRDGECADGNCGPKIGTAANKPCIPEEQIPEGVGAHSVQTGWGEIDGFQWNEVSLP